MLAVFQARAKVAARDPALPSHFQHPRILTSSYPHICHSSVPFSAAQVCPEGAHQILLNGDRSAVCASFRTMTVQQEEVRLPIAPSVGSPAPDLVAFLTVFGRLYLLQDAAVLVTSLRTLAVQLASERESATARQQLLLASTPLFAHVKAFNRSVYEDSKAAKAEVAEARSGVDAARLNLQNLKYERNQLSGEIRKCQEFR